MKHKKIGLVVFQVAAFVFLLLFFTYINPLTIYDTDDWLYIYQKRLPIPMLYVWNPIRVFPEFFMPCVSYFAAYIIKPLVGDYFFSLTLAHALFGSLIITVYFSEFVLLLYKTGRASQKRSIWLGVLFIGLHFILFINNGSNNYFLLHAVNVTCFYFYTLPVCLNAALVMHFMANGGVEKCFKDASWTHRLLILVWVYFSLNSNLYSSVVLAAYVGAELLVSLYGRIKEKEFYLLEYGRDYPLSLFIAICWLASHVFEKTGGRADSMMKNLFSSFWSAILMLLVKLGSMNFFFIIFAVAVFVLWKKKSGVKLVAYTDQLLNIVLTLFYLVILCSFVESAYMAKTEAIFGFMFWILLYVCLGFNRLINVKVTYRHLAFILLGTAVLLAINPSTHIFRSYNCSNIPYADCKACMNDIVAQFKDAESKNIQEISLVVPDFEIEGNWPIAENAIDRFSEALCSHKVIKSPIRVKEYIKSKDKIKEYHIGNISN